MKDKIEFMIKLICEVPRTSYQIIAELSKDQIYISYPTLMSKLGVLVAKEELSMVKTLKGTRLYKNVPQQIIQE